MDAMMRRFAMGCVLGWTSSISAGQVVAGIETAAIPLQVYDTNSHSYVAPILAPGTTCRGLAADDARRIIYMATGPRLMTIPYDEPRTIREVGYITGDVPRIDGGLAFDSRRNMLICTTGTAIILQSRRFFEVDTTNASIRLIWDYGAGDFGGIDYDPDRDVIFAANDSPVTTDGLSGRGIYMFPLPLGSALPTKIAPYPFKSGTTLETDIDGLAVGFGKIYLCADETNWMYVYDIASGTYEAPIAQTAFGTDRNTSGATFARSLLRGGAFDTSVEVLAPADCSVHVGETGVYTVTARNAGTRTVSGASVRVTLPSASVFVGSNPAGSLVGSQLTVAVGTLAPQQSIPINVTVLLTQAGLNDMAASVSATEQDADPSNNSAHAATRAAPAAPLGANASGVFSTVAGSASSRVPGMPGARFRDGPEAFGRPYHSAAGSRFVVSAQADIADTATDSVVILVDGSGAHLVGREGVTPAVPGPGGNLPPTAFDAVMGVNDSGYWAFSGRDARGAFAAYAIDGQGTVAAREGEQAPPLSAGIVFGSQFGSVGVGYDGSMSFISSLRGPGVTGANDAAAFTLSGSAIAARKGYTIPMSQTDFTGQATFFTIKTLDIGSAAGGFSMDAFGEHYVMTGEINGSATSPPPGGVDRVLMRDEWERGVPRVYVQENRPLGALNYTRSAADTAPYSFAYMEPQGVWLAAVTTADGADLALRDNMPIAQTGEEISPGAGELWSRARTAPAFTGVCENAAGDWIVIGATDRADALRDTVAVRNGTEVLARENDPVDLDGNGQFDDGVYIGAFVPHHCFAGPDALYAVVRLRSEAAAGACGPSDDVGGALIRIAFEPEAPACPADFNGDGGVDGADVEAFFVAWEAAETGADVNQDGGIDGADIETFFVSWEAGGC